MRRHNVEEQPQSHLADPPPRPPAAHDNKAAKGCGNRRAPEGARMEAGARARAAASRDTVGGRFARIGGQD